MDRLRYSVNWSVTNKRDRQVKYFEDENFARAHLSYITSQKVFDSTKDAFIFDEEKNKRFVTVYEGKWIEENKCPPWCLLGQKGINCGGKHQMEPGQVALAGFNPEPFEPSHICCNNESKACNEHGPCSIYEDKFKEPQTRDAEYIAKEFHITYERLAPSFDWETQESSRVAWEDLPASNRDLMIATVAELLKEGVIK